jgi:hypothetical protein
MLLFDTLKAVFVMPFINFADCPTALKQAGKKNSRGKTLTYIAIGILITIPTTGLIVSLLSQADETFKSLLNYFFKDSFKDIIVNVIQLLFSIPFAFYIFSTWMANMEKKKTGLLTPEKSKLFINKIRFAPEAMVYTAVTPICIVYLIFFASQTAYFLSAFSNILPEGITYAEYARRGFFELCGVIVINIIIILAMLLFSKRKVDKAPKPLKVYIIMLSTFTIMLIATAISKMVMYIDNYGLTLLRVYTTWFMVLAGLIFVLLIINQFNSKLNFMKAGSIVFILMFALLCFSDVDGQIANYNVSRYETGTLKSVDIGMMYDLSDSAVKYVAQLSECKDITVATEAKEYLESKQKSFKNQSTDWRKFNLSTNKAKEVLSSYNK